MTNGWNESASAWITDMGTEGDFSRKFVLDPPMMKRVMGKGYRRALDGASAAAYLAGLRRSAA